MKNLYPWTAVPVFIPDRSMQLEKMITKPLCNPV